MRTIERQIAEEIRNCSPDVSNARHTRNLSKRDRIVFDGDELQVFLWSTKIATVRKNSVILSSGGHHTLTTKSRLNAILEAVGIRDRIYQKNFEWFMDGCEFADGIQIARN